jgi:hypothetical protein
MGQIEMNANEQELFELLAKMVTAIEEGEHDRDIGAATSLLEKRKAAYFRRLEGLDRKRHRREMVDELVEVYSELECEQEERAVMQDEIDRFGEDVYWDHAGIIDVTFAELDNVTSNDAGEPNGYC